MLFCGSEYSANCHIKRFVVTLWCVPSFDKEVPNFFFFLFLTQEISESKHIGSCAHIL